MIFTIVTCHMFAMSDNIHSYLISFNKFPSIKISNLTNGVQFFPKDMLMYENIYRVHCELKHRHNCMNIRIAFSFAIFSVSQSKRSFSYLFVMFFVACEYYIWGC